MGCSSSFDWHLSIYRTWVGKLHRKIKGAGRMGSSIEVLREQMVFLLDQGLHESAELLVCN